VDARELLEVVWRTNVRADIEQARAEGPPEAIGLVPADEQVDVLLLSRWKAAERDCALLYDGKEVYEKNIDDLGLSDAKNYGAFCELLGSTLLQSSDEHKFVADVTYDIEALPGDGGFERGGEE
jgi:hypothetical protein